MAQQDQFLQSGGQDFAAMAAQAANGARPEAVGSSEPMHIPMPAGASPPSLPPAAVANNTGGRTGGGTGRTPKNRRQGGGSPNAGSSPSDFMGFQSGFEPLSGVPPNMAGMMSNPYMAGMGMPGMMPGMKPGMMPGMGMPGMMPGMMNPMMNPMMMGMNPMMGMMPNMATPQPSLSKGKGGGKGANRVAEGDKKTRPSRSQKKKKDGEDEQQVDEASLSEELREVRRNQGKSDTVRVGQISAQISDFAKDQHGSRFLQTKCEENAEDREIIFRQILPYATELSDSSFGNFVVQKLFDTVALDQKKELASQFTGNVYDLSTKQHGCRVIQKAINLLPRDAQQQLAAELHGVVSDCIMNPNGNHVIQKCIEQMPPDSVGFIIDCVVENVKGKAEHMYGCRVIQRLLEHCTPQQLQAILSEIVRLVEDLSKNNYGNYVVQHMLEHGRMEDKKHILQTVTSKVMDFAQQKQSSNVVEKCFEVATVGEHADELVNERSALFQALLSPYPGESEIPVQKLAKDKFGNYIVQRMIEHAKGEAGQIKALLVPIISELLSSTNGKHIVESMKKEKWIPDQ